MRARRWDQAHHPNVSDPNPLYPFPNAYDLQIDIDRIGMWLYIGPARKLKDPQGRFHHANLTMMPSGFIPSLSNNWTGLTKLKFKTSKGAKWINIDYIDASGNMIASSRLDFTV
jgi:hypothetical protein